MDARVKPGHDALRVARLLLNRARRNEKPVRRFPRTDPERYAKRIALPFGQLFEPVEHRRT